MRRKNTYRDLVYCCNNTNSDYNNKNMTATQTSITYFNFQLEIQRKFDLKYF